MMNVSDDDGRLFLQFDHCFASDGKNSDSLQCIERMIGWANPDLIFLFKSGPVNTFIDCTFKCTVKGFTQLMVIMLYSQPHDTYVPVFYILLQSKDESTYHLAFQLALCSSGLKLSPKTVTCDFEKGLVNAAKKVFSTSIHRTLSLPLETSHSPKIDQSSTEVTWLCGYPIDWRRWRTYEFLNSNPVARNSWVWRSLY